MPLNKKKDVIKEEISSVVFCGKSNKKTGNSPFMFKALQRKIKKAIYINTPRYRRLFFWTDYEKVIEKKILKANPGLILIYSLGIPIRLLKKLSKRYKTAIYYPDCRIPINEEIITYAREVDYFFINNKTQPEELKNKGAKNPIFCMQGCDRDAHRIVPTRRKKWASEVAFIGGPHERLIGIGGPHERRIELFRKIDQKYYFKTWGGDWNPYGFTCLKKNIYPKEYAKICFASSIIMGNDMWWDIECYFSNRTWITLGCGGFLLTSYVPNLETIFKKGVHLEWYRDNEECLDLIEYYLKHGRERRRIALSGYEFAHANRTYDIVIDEMLSKIKIPFRLYDNQ